MTDDHLDGYGLPWSTEPVPWPLPAPDRVQQRRLVRHFGRRGARYPNDYELLPVSTDRQGQLPGATQQPQPERTRPIMGGGGSVRVMSAEPHIFRRQEIPPRPTLTFGYLARNWRDHAPAGVEGPAELVYVWNGRQPPPASLGGVRWV